MTLNNLIVINVESDNAPNLDLNKAENKFASTNARRYHLQY